METNRIFVICSVILVISLTVIQYADANPQVTLFTHKNNYTYGEHLSYTIKISEVTGENAVLKIRDYKGTNSSPIYIPLSQRVTTFTAPFPFDPLVFGEGKYFLDLEYSGSTNSTEFNLMDTGNSFIPFWIKDFAKFWFDGTIPDKEFAKGIEFLIKEQIIVIPETQMQEKNELVRIPNWIKTITGWWIEGKISDQDFASGLEYLIKVGIIVV